MRDAAPTGGRRQVVTGFARGLSVIEAFGPANKTMTVADVAAHTGLDRAVARRLQCDWLVSHIETRLDPTWRMDAFVQYYD